MLEVHDISTYWEDHVLCTSATGRPASAGQHRTHDCQWPSTVYLGYHHQRMSYSLFISTTVLYICLSVYQCLCKNVPVWHSHKFHVIYGCIFHVYSNVSFQSCNSLFCTYMYRLIFSVLCLCLFSVCKCISPLPACLSVCLCLCLCLSQNVHVWHSYKWNFHCNLYSLHIGTGSSSFFTTSIPLSRTELTTSSTIVIFLTAPLLLTPATDVSLFTAVTHYC